MGTICSFSGIYQEMKMSGGLEKGRLSAFTFLDCQDIRGTNGYCDPEAADEIRRRIAPYPENDIHLLDNGNYHYLTRFWLEKRKETFDLVVFDHHTDMQPSALLPVLSCGNWVLETLKDTDIPVRRLILIGPPKKDLDRAFLLMKEIREETGVSFPEIKAVPEEADISFSEIKAVPEEADISFPEIKAVPEEAGFLPDGIREAAALLFGSEEKKTAPPVYLSIDKDVLAEEELSVSWDQGRMPSAVLAEWIRAIAAHRQICGADLCGEPEEASDEARMINEALVGILTYLFKKT